MIDSSPHTELRSALAKLRAIRAEAAEVIAHFEEHPFVTAEDATEEDARWVMRYDAVCAELQRLGHDV